MNNISSLLSQWHIEGLVVGLATFLIIGLFHPLVIKGEYYFGVKCWIAFLIFGIGMGILSVALGGGTASIIAGVTAFSSFWSIGEVFEQRKRVARGWFPTNPRRAENSHSENQGA